MNTVISLEQAVVFLGAIGTIYGLYTAWKNNIKKDDETISTIREDHAKEITDLKEDHVKEITDLKMQNISVLSEINKQLTSIDIRQEQQCTQLTDMQADIKSTKSELREVREEQIQQRSEIKSIWRNIDELKSTKKEGE